MSAVLKTPVPPRLITPPASLAVELCVAKRHMVIEHFDDDDLIRAYITAATAKAEEDTRRGFIRQTWRQVYDGMPCEIVLRRCPVLTVDAEGDPLLPTVTYVDSEGVSHVVDDADLELDAESAPARLRPADSATWPYAIDCGRMNSLQVDYQVGYGDEAADVPPLARQLVLFLTSHYYHQRCPVGQSTAEVPLGYPALVSSLSWTL